MPGPAAHIRNLALTTSAYRLGERGEQRTLQRPVAQSAGEVLCVARGDGVVGITGGGEESSSTISGM